MPCSGRVFSQAQEAVFEGMRKLPAPRDAGAIAYEFIELDFSEKLRYEPSKLTSFEKGWEVHRGEVGARRFVLVLAAWVRQSVK